jgi:hypothetical protein
MRFASLFVWIWIALAPLSASAQEMPTQEAMPGAPAFAPHHALGVSVMGVFGFTRTNLGPFTLSYEWIVDDHWGIFVEGHFLHFHGHPVHINVTGGAAGVRYHFFGLRHSPFVGIAGGYHHGFGRIDHVGGQALPVTASQPFVVAHAGYRWVWPFGLNVTVRIGAGYGPYEVHGSDGTPEADAAVLAAREAIGFTPVAIDSELSVGYSF